MANVTTRIAEPISGDSLYQVRARRALPLLVRQAEAGQQIFYSHLADELGMPNPRNLNYGRARQRGGICGVVEVAVDHAAAVEIGVGRASIIGVASSAIASVCM